MRIIAAMSGGVDSSAAAALLREQGHDVIGLFMRNGVHSELEGGKGCCTLEDANDAKAVAAHLGIPFYAINFEYEFSKLIDYFIDEYDRGRTPNPCVMCNRMLKFGHLLQFAREVGAEAVATGHYARTAQRDGRTLLLRSADKEKEQSYVLFNQTQKQLAASLFPLGEMKKSEVREVARRAGLRVHDKHESQDICFVPTGDYRDVLNERAPKILSPGPIVNETGSEVGQHEGVQLYTIGQRKGLRIGGLDSPRYVVGLDRDNNTVRIGPKRDLLQKECTIHRPNWISFDKLEEPVRCSAQIRYHHEPAAATLKPLEDDRARIVFDVPQSAITPGQAAVCYDDDEVLGGGWIE